jgi:hypothetical protein
MGIGCEVEAPLLDIAHDPIASLRKLCGNHRDGRSIALDGPRCLLLPQFAGHCEGYDERLDALVQVPFGNQLVSIVTDFVGAKDGVAIDLAVGTVLPSSCSLPINEF